MKATEKRRKICDSWYHQTWFRAVLVIVAIDMIVLGFTFTVGIDIISLVYGVNPLVRIVLGLMYMAVALFIVHYALAYDSIKKESHFVCHHCGHIKNKNQKEKED